MKKSIKNIATIGLITASSLFSGCHSDTGFRVKLLDISAGHQGSTFISKDNQTTVAKEIYKTDTQPYDDSTISNGAIQGSPLWKSYQTGSNK